MNVKRIELLDGEMRLISGDEERPLKGPTLQCLVAELLARSQTGATPKELMRALGCAKGALQQNLYRLRTIHDLHVLNDNERYQILHGTLTADVTEFIDAADLGEAHATADQVRRALALWKSGPPDILRSTLLWNRLHAARTKLDQRRAQLVRRRLLIVEDQVGDRLCEVLGDYDCTVVRDLQGFWAVRPYLGSMFDGALVDLHLRPGYEDRDGEIVVDAINSSSALPAVLMTFRMPGGFDVIGFQRRYNLVSVVTKKDDGPNADFGGIASVVREMFAADAGTRLFEMLEDTLPSLRRRAGKQLRLTGRLGSLDMMHLKYNKVVGVAQRGDLAS
ncbi:hypothetical protein ACWGE0_35435, partial [Lentzea sp. NPDC054927]